MILACISSVCLVVAPLVFLHENQVDGLRRRGITAAIIGPESTAAELKEILLGAFKLVFGNPEASLNSYRTVIRDLKDSIKVVFIDEFHCIVK